MKKTEIKRLKVGDKYIKTNNYGEKSIRTIKFICYLNNKPFFIFYGTGLGQRNCYEDLLSDSYQIYKINEKVLGSTQEESVSEDLEEAAFDYAEACKYEGGEKLLCVEHFKAGAKYKEEQFEKNLLEHCNSISN